MPVDSSVPYFPRWFLALWRKIISAPHSFTRRSISILHLVLAILRRRFRRLGGRCTGDNKSTKTISSSGPTIALDLSCRSDSFPGVCPSNVPIQMGHLSSQLQNTQSDLSSTEKSTCDSPSPSRSGNIASHSHPDIIAGPNSAGSQQASHNDGDSLKPLHVNLHPHLVAAANHSNPSHNLSVIPESPPSINNGSLCPDSFIAQNASRSSLSSYNGSIASLATGVSYTHANGHVRPMYIHPSAIHSVQSVPASHMKSQTSLFSSGGPEHARVVPVHNIAPLSPGREVESNLAMEKHTVFAMTPAWSERYFRPADVQAISAHFTVGPMTRSFDREDIPSGWAAHIHPEGTLYFYDKQRNIITDAYLCNTEILQLLEDFYKQIEQMRQASGFIVPPDCQLIMELMPAATDDDILCGYYYVDHQTRSLFWLREFEADFILSSTRGVISHNLMKHEIESQYWKHREYFPNLYELSPDIVDELRGIMVHAIGDNLTADNSTSPYSADKLTSMLNLVNEFKDRPVHNSHFDSYVSRMMGTFAHQRLINYHGEKCPRLSRNQSIYLDEKIQRPILVTFLSPLLFFAPDIHLRALEDIFVDHTLSEGPWVTFIANLDQEWKDFLLLAEVLLTVNVSFLAIPSVDTTNPGQNASPQRSMTQIASYVSMVATIGSIFMGLLLVRQNQTKGRESVKNASNFLQMMSNSMLGLETLAILYSLPYALLMWGMLSFVAAFSGMCFSDTELTSRLPVGISGLAVFALVAWCIWTAWETTIYTRFCDWPNRFTAFWRKRMPFQGVFYKSWRQSPAEHTISV